jgi:membrane protein
VTLVFKMRRAARTVASLARDTFDKWRRDDALQLGAALAYYTVFSLAPLLIVAIAVAGLVFGEDAARGQVVDEVKDFLGPEGARTIQATIERAGRGHSGLLATLLGLGTIFFGSSAVFGQLRKSLNQIWDVQPPVDGGFLHVVRSRIASFGMVLGVGFLLLVSLALSAVVTAVGDYLGGQLPVLRVGLGALDLLLSLATSTLLFAMIYRFLPDVRLAWSDVWLGAGVTALLFSIGKQSIGFYLGRSGATSIYGAAGSLVLILLWVYYSSQILFLGAEFIHVYTHRQRSVDEPVREPSADRTSDSGRAAAGESRM